MVKYYVSNQVKGTEHILSKFTDDTKPEGAADVLESKADRSLPTYNLL